MIITLRIFLLGTLLSVVNVCIAAQSSPWDSIRQHRINQLLPHALKAGGAEAWLIICRENNNDPLAKHIGCENAGKTAVFLFYLNGGKLSKIAYSPVGEALALADLDLLDTVIPIENSESAIVKAAEFINKKGLEKIAINVSTDNPQADGLSYSQYQALLDAIGREHTSKFVSSEDVVYSWLSVKLPEEVEIMRNAAKLTAQWQLEAYAQIVPGVTRDSDVARYLKAKMEIAGVTDAWSPDQNPNVVSGADRGHSHATDKVIMPGDVIQTDFGIRVHDTWVTDIQRFAYVLKPDEIAPPADITRYWENAKAGRKAAFGAMKPGSTDQQVDAAQRKILIETKSLPVKWSTGHPVGYEAHDTGPALSDGNKIRPRKAARLELKQGMTFAFDGFYSWKLSDGSIKTISMEEVVLITEDGAEYLIPPQEDLILIPSTNLLN
nr:M24 family metallopeptidase [Alteromonas sp. ASW11-130]